MVGEIGLRSSTSNIPLSTPSQNANKPRSNSLSLPKNGMVKLKQDFNIRSEPVKTSLLPQNLLKFTESDDRATSGNSKTSNTPTMPHVTLSRSSFDEIIESEEDSSDDEYFDLNDAVVDDDGNFIEFGDLHRIADRNRADEFDFDDTESDEQPMPDPQTRGPGTSNGLRQSVQRQPEGIRGSETKDTEDDPETSSDTTEEQIVKPTRTSSKDAIVIAERDEDDWETSSDTTEEVPSGTSNSIGTSFRTGGQMFQPNPIGNQVPVKPRAEMNQVIASIRDMPTEEIVISYDKPLRSMSIGTINVEKTIAPQDQGSKDLKSDIAGTKKSVGNTSNFLKSIGDLLTKPIRYLHLKRLEVSTDTTKLANDSTTLLRNNPKLSTGKLHHIVGKMVGEARTEYDKAKKTFDERANPRPNDVAPKFSDFLTKAVTESAFTVKLQDFGETFGQLLKMEGLYSGIKHYEGHAEAISILKAYQADNKNSTDLARHYGKDFNTYISNQAGTKTGFRQNEFEIKAMTVVASTGGSKAFNEIKDKILELLPQNAPQDWLEANNQLKDKNDFNRQIDFMMPRIIDFGNMVIDQCFNFDTQTKVNAMADKFDPAFRDLLRNGRELIERGGERLQPNEVSTNQEKFRNGLLLLRTLNSDLSVVVAPSLLKSENPQQIEEPNTDAKFRSCMIGGISKLFQSLVAENAVGKFENNVKQYPQETVQRLQALSIKLNQNLERLYQSM